MTTATTTHTKPPLGVAPRFIADNHRVTLIEQAIERYLSNDREIPLEWVSEYAELILRNHWEPKFRIELKTNHSILDLDMDVPATPETPAVEMDVDFLLSAWMTLFHACRCDPNGSFPVEIDSSTETAATVFEVFGGERTILYKWRRLGWIEPGQIFTKWTIEGKGRVGVRLTKLPLSITPSRAKDLQP